MGEGEQFQFAWGGGLQARLGEAFGLKAQITHTSRSGEISTPSGNIKIDLSVSEITVSPTATFGSVYFGPQLGLALVGLSTDAGGSTGSAFEVGGNLGLSFPLSEHVSVGPDFHYTYLPSVLIEGLDLPSANIFKLLFRVSAGF
ncbi:MAG: outer membrane beta-barrel protein [Bdellovibrionales bacterium]|nr:outer membrane beta-barrel protein [Bdellovibrionales bacterium]